VHVVGSGDDRVSDPSNLDRDQGVTPFHQAHTFAVSTVLAPSFSGRGLGTALLNNNQLGVIVQANSGLPFNIRSTNIDLNRDGVLNDRPLNIERNTGRLGVLNIDLRYSRFIPVSGTMRGELFFEAKNLFNTENISAVNRLVATDASGALLAPLPDPFPPTGGYDQRQMQLGVKFTF
jgi:hypothetical protein